MIKQDMSTSDIVRLSVPNNEYESLVLNSFYLKTYEEDEHVSRMCRNQGFWEPEVTSWMTKNVKEGWTCLDVGSNIGYFTEVLSRLTGPSGRVIAFEPNQNILNDYKKIMEKNNYLECSPIELYNFGLSDENKAEKLIVPTWNIGGASVKFNNFEVPEDWGVLEVELKKYDDLSFSDIDVDFIKIDIEGSEPEAFYGMQKALKNCKLIVMELGYYHPIEFLKYISSKYHISMIDSEGETEIKIDKILSENHHLNVALRRKI